MSSASTAAAAASSKGGASSGTTSAAKKDKKPSSTSASGSSAGAKKKATITADQRYYAVDPEQLSKLQEDKPWMKSAKYFTKVAVSPSAVTKMMMHCASGVEKGIAKGGNPIEGEWSMPDSDSSRTRLSAVWKLHN
jgi:hypothetical protein